LNAYVNSLLLQFIMNTDLINKFFLFVMLSLVLIALAHPAQCQNVNNPFEIKNRIIKESDVQAPDSIIADNVKLINSNIQNPEFQKEKIDSKKEIILSDKNPFEVDHIPLRKKDVITEKTDNYNNTGQDNIGESRSFIYWTILLGLILLTLATSSNRKLFGKVLKAIFNENILKQEFRSGASLALEYILLYLVYFINGGIFLLLIWNFFYDGDVTLKNLSLCIALLIGVYSTRHIAMNILGSIFPFEKEAKLYSFTIQLFNASIGICLIPINLFLAFGPESITKIVLFIGFSLICILLIIRIVRGVTISLSFIFNRLILFFVYLCSLEIAPMVVLVKLIEKINY